MTSPLRGALGLLACAAVACGGGRAAAPAETPRAAAPAPAETPHVSAETRAAAPAETRAPTPAETPPAVAAAETPPAPPPGRPLTRGELALLRPLFRDSIDYTTVRVVDAAFGPFHPDGVMMSPTGAIHAPGLLFRSDYAARTIDPVLLADFVHEVVHVWQFQSGQNLLAEALSTFAAYRGNYQLAYAYTLDPACDLLDYNVEQQAAIVTDWFLIRRRRDPRDLAAPATPQAYQTVLHAFLADPSYARSPPPPSGCRDPRPSP